MEWSPRRVDGLAVWLGLWGSFGGVGEVWCWADGVGLAAPWGWALVPEMAMGLPLKVACSEVAIALGGAAAMYLSVGFWLFWFRRK
ncbi:MAG: hypothetical protein ACO2PN_08425 [Pyrobaculum sp.]